MSHSPQFSSYGSTAKTTRIDIDIDSQQEVMESVHISVRQITCQQSVPTIHRLEPNHAFSIHSTSSCNAVGDAMVNDHHPSHIIHHTSRTVLCSTVHSRSLQIPTTIVSIVEVGLLPARQKWRLLPLLVPMLIMVH